MPEVRGLRALTRELTVNLPRYLRRKVFGKMVRAAANEVKKEARRRCPRGRGHLTIRTSGKRRGTFFAKHLYQTIMVSRVRVVGGMASATVHAGKGRPIAHLVEFGAAAHIIEPVKIGYIMSAKEKRFLKLPGSRYTARVRHPGMTGRPFMRPALESSKGRATAAMIRVGRRELRKYRRAA